MFEKSGRHDLEIVMIHNQETEVYVGDAAAAAACLFTVLVNQQ